MRGGREPYRGRVDTEDYRLYRRPPQHASAGIGHPRPFVWTKPADAILEPIARFASRSGAVQSGSL